MSRPCTSVCARAGLVVGVCVCVESVVACHGQVPLTIYRANEAGPHSEAVTKQAFVWGAPGFSVDNWWVDSISGGVVIINHRIVRLGQSTARRLPAPSEWPPSLARRERAAAACAGRHTTPGAAQLFVRRYPLLQRPAPLRTAWGPLRALCVCEANPTKFYRDFMHIVEVSHRQK